MGSGDGPSSVLHLPTCSRRGFKAFSPLIGNNLPIRTHISELSDEARLEKLCVKRRAKPREFERQHQVGLIKWVKSIKDAYPVLKLLYAVPNGGHRNVKLS
jgi:hypothetical protein